MSEHYTTPPGLDEREITTPPIEYTEEELEKFKQQGIKFVKWNDTIFAEGPGIDKDFFDDVSRKINQSKSVIIAVTGPPGIGKTYWALRVAEIIDKKFDPELQVTFEREQILHLLSAESPLEAGQVIIIDEAHFSSGSRSWFIEMQKQLVNIIASVRFRGYVLIIVALHISMLDVILRKHVLNFHIYIEDAGRGVPYNLYMRRFDDRQFKNRIGTSFLKLPGYKECSHPNCLKYEKGKCPYFEECMNIRAIYERCKRDFLDKEASLSKKAEEIEKKRKELPRRANLIEKLYEQIENLTLTSHNNIDETSIIDVIDEEYGYTIGRIKAQGLGKSLIRKHPDTIDKLKQMS